MNAQIADRIRLLEECRTSQSVFPVGSQGYVTAVPSNGTSLWTFKMDCGLHLRTSDPSKFEVLRGQAYGHGPAVGQPLTVTLKPGARIRTTQDFPTVPKGSHGVIDGQGSHPGDWHVTMDDGQDGYLKEYQMEVLTPVFASHYQAQPIGDGSIDPPDTDDDHDYTPVAKEESTSLSGDQLMDITRSFCRGY